MEVTITGSSGFVGENLKQYLSEFTVNDLFVRYKANQIINLQKTNAIIHLAGKAHDLKNVAQPSAYYEANFELTKQLYDAFLKSDAKKFIFISSVKAAADSVEGVLTENYTPNPQTHYGISKLRAEEYIMSQVLPEGKSYYILRPCMIHGPGNKGNLNLLYQFVKKGIPYPLAAFDNKRSFLSVKNLCFVIKELLEREDVFSGIYNVSDDEAISTNQLVTIIGEALTIKSKLWNVNQQVVNLLARLGDKLNLPLNSERLKKLTESYIVDNSKIKAVLKRDLPISTREGLIKTIQSFRSL